MSPIAEPGQHVQLSTRSWLHHVTGWAEDPDIAMSALLQELHWKQQTIHMHGRLVAQPRLTAVCGLSMDPASRYRRPNPDQPWTPAAAAVLVRVALAIPGWQPHGLLSNLYRSGSDSVSWHSDDEPALGPTPTVASVSYGATRRFQLKRLHRRVRDHSDTWTRGPAHHGRSNPSGVPAPKTRKAHESRLSLTFRRYYR